VLGVAVRAAELSDDLARIVRARTTAPENTAAVPQALAPDDMVGARDLQAALPLFTNRTYGQGDVANELLAVGLWLDGQSPARLPVSGLQWEDWVGSIRAIAVLATSPGQSAESREAILRLLRIWQRSPLARDVATTRVAVFRVKPPNGMVPKEPNVSVWLAFEDASRYFVRQTQNVDDTRVLRVVERTRDGVFRVPEGVALESEKLPQGDADNAWLGTFLEEMKTRGAPTWNPDVVTELTRRAGLTRAEATLLWAGLPRMGNYLNDFLGKELRTALGLKVPEAKAAAETFQRLPAEFLLGLFNAAAPEDPRALWSPLGAGPQDDTSPVARLAGAWVAQRGRRAEIREDLIVTCKQEIRMPLSPAAALGALLDPKGAACMQVKRQDAAERGTVEHFGAGTLSSIATLVRFLFAALPVGDSYRSAVPALVEAARARLADPSLVLPLGQGWFGGEARPQAVTLMETLGGKESKQGETIVRDTGTLLVSLGPNGHLGVSFRPAQVTDYAREPQFENVAKLMYSQDHALGAARFLSSTGCNAILERIRGTPVPEGHWEANPQLSSPEAVKVAGRKLGLREDAATLYLQLLALPRPSNRNVQLWNGWGTGEVKAAGEALLSKKLVVEGKRERAGRELFLPGAWNKARAIEPWKEGLYADAETSGNTILPSVPIHVLFEHAWKRIAAGDRPAFEEV
jgi:hypothetical protein